MVSTPRLRIEPGSTAYKADFACWPSGSFVVNLIDYGYRVIDYKFVVIIPLAA